MDCVVKTNELRKTYALFFIFKVQFEQYVAILGPNEWQPFAFQFLITTLNCRLVFFLNINIKKLLY